MKTFFDDEKRYVGITIKRTDGDPFTIANAQYEIRGALGDILVPKTNATIDGSDVSMLFDTTIEGIDAGRRYWVFFYIGITGSAEQIVTTVVVDVIG